MLMDGARHAMFMFIIDSAVKVILRCHAFALASGGGPLSCIMLFIQ